MSEIDVASSRNDGKEEAPVIVDMVFAAFLLLIGGVFFYTALGINSDAGIWPRTLAFSLVILAGMQFLRAFRRFLRADAIPVLSDWHAHVRRALTAGWILAYCLIAPWTGFGPAMAVMMPVYMWLAGERRIWLILVATTLAAGLISFLFGQVAGVPVWEADL